MLATIIAKIGLPFLVSIIGSALGTVNNPVAQSAAKALENFQGAVADGAVTADQIAEANRHAESMAQMKSKEYETAMTEINATIRGEAGSNDAYVRRMRPTFGYLMAITWAVQMVALAYVVIFETDKAPAVLSSMESLSTIWGVGLSVLGIYVYKRSEEKKPGFITAAPAPQPSAAPIVTTSNIKPAAASGVKTNE